ncbi:MAG: hypothetical protein ACI4XL_07385 [Bacillus sp. (in: firmicutes)]
MKRNLYNKPQWFRVLRNAVAPFVIPFCVFQGIRTFFFPTPFDVLFLFLLLALAFCITYNIF